MGRYVLVTEGPTDAVILRSILKISPDDPCIIIEAAGGWSSADSYARTVLVENEADVALVVDADSTDPNIIEDRKRFLQRSLGSIPTRKKFRIVVIEPDITYLLFKDRTVLHQLVGRPVEDTDYVAASFDARRVLTRLLGPGNAMQILRDRLAEVDLSFLANDPVLRDLKNFLHITQQREPAAI